jgi:hypothetical protein
MSIGGLMALSIPIALYSSVFSLAQETPESFVTVLFFAASGFIVAVIRRASLAMAVVQWCVPPSIFVVVWSASLVLDNAYVFSTAFVLMVLSLGSALNWITIRMGARNVPWLKDWIGDSLLCGFAHSGLAFLFTFPILGCLYLISVV